jgi:hypothetical protein
MSKLDSEKIKEIAINRPYIIEIMQLQILYDLASMLEEVLTTLKEGTPEGKVMEWRQEVTGEKPFYIDFTKEVYKRLFSITIVNEGDYDVRAIVKIEGISPKEIIINPGMTEIIDLKRAKIENITFYMVEKDKTSIVKILGVY